MILNVCVSSISGGPVGKRPKCYYVNRIPSKTSKSEVNGGKDKEKKKLIKTHAITRQLKKIIKKIHYVIVKKFM